MKKQAIAPLIVGIIILGIIVVIGVGFFMMRDSNGVSEIEDSRGSDSEAWCYVGSAGTLPIGQGMTGEFKGIETSGEFAGYCHIQYVSINTEGTGITDVYFDENNEGYSVTTVNGREISRIELK